MPTDGLSATLGWGPAATITAAAIGLLGLLVQQVRHWRETRRDKLRDAYAEWMSALARARRTEERALNTAILARDELELRKAAGDRIAMAGGLEMTREARQELRWIDQDIESCNRELDVAFAKVCLLDADPRRVAAAQTVSLIETLPSLSPPTATALEQFEERWIAKSRALGELAALINRTLLLEGKPEFLWDWSERQLEDRQAHLHARLRVNRKGVPRREAETTE